MRPKGSPRWFLALAPLVMVLGLLAPAGWLAASLGFALAAKN